ncbi:MAG: ABC transporter ATP-binding protein [Pseudomonadota bacterium]
MTEPVTQADAPGLREAVRQAGALIALVWRTAPALSCAIAAATVLLALAPALAAYLAKLIVDGVLAALETGTPEDRRQVMIWVAAEAGVLGGMLALRRMLAFLKRVLHAELGQAVSRVIFDKTLSMDLCTIEDATVQEKIILARKHAAARPFALISRLFDTAQFTITIATFSAVLWSFHPLAVFVIVIGGLPLFIGELRFSSEAFRFYTAQTAEMRRRTYLEGLMTSDGAATERLHARSGDAVLNRYRALFQSMFGADRRLQGRRAWAGVALIAASSLIFVLGKGWVVWETVLGAITLGQMIMYAALLKQGQNTMTSLLATASGGYEDLLYASNLFTLLALPEGVRRGALEAGPKPGDGYRLSAVRFSYPSTQRPAIDGLNLHIPAGQRLGVVGANGSGKTTLIKLLTGLYLPDEGEITLDGAPIADWAPEALFARTAALFQPFGRYNLTAGENIAIGSDLESRDTQEDALWAAAEAGLAAQMIREWPDGMDTRLSRQFLDGRELSGGQWQRLALSRALMRTQADTLILDEPTSALDPEAEAELLQTAARPDRTTILVSHRLSNLRAADRIIVLERGRIIEAGSHGELVAEGGVYAAMFDTQGAFYRDEN